MAQVVDGKGHREAVLGESLGVHLLVTRVEYEGPDGQDLTGRHTGVYSRGCLADASQTGELQWYRRTGGPIIMLALVLLLCLESGQRLGTHCGYAVVRRQFGA